MKNFINRALSENKKIVVFGTGELARIFRSRFYSLTIDYYVDNDKQKWGSEFNGVRINSPNYLQNEEKSSIFIIIASSFYTEISLQLNLMGFVKGYHYLKYNNNPLESVISSPIHHNSKERIEELYREVNENSNLLEAIIEDRHNYFSTILDFVSKKEIDINSKNIVDIGCGTGDLLIEISKRFSPASISGLEYAETAIKIAKSRFPLAEYCYFDIYGDFPKKFDVIFCMSVLEHLIYPDKAIANILKMIGNNGVAILTVPNGRKDTYEGHINFWSPESWEVFIKKECCGFFSETILSDEGYLIALIKN